jgi:hypothetical protein
MAKSRELPRSVVDLPELLPVSYRNRVLNLSPRDRNQGVQHLPGSHKQLSAERFPVWLPETQKGSGPTPENLSDLLILCRDGWI